VTHRTALVVVPAVLVLTGCAGTAPAAGAGSSSAPTDTSTSGAEAPARRIEVTVSGGTVSGDTGRVPVEQGETLELVITSDTADEVHVHGYDVTARVTPDRPAALTFRADLPGVFEVELHDAGTRLLSLQVG
jgi:hypothetical protein